MPYLIFRKEIEGLEELISLIMKFHKILFVFMIVQICFSNYIIINEIIVEGNQILNDSQTVSSSGLGNYKNQIISFRDYEELTKNTINGLWETGRYSNVKIYEKLVSENEIILYLKVEENPILDQITFNGNSFKSDKKLLEEVSLGSGIFLSDKAIYDSIQKIKQMYFESNYHSISIRHEIKPSDRGGFYKNLEFIFNEGEKQTISSIEINGNNHFTDWKLSRLLENTKPWKWYFFWRGDWDEIKYNEDKERIKSFYYNEGYRDFHIVSDSVIYDNKDIKIVINVYEGPKYYYRSIEWSGNTKFTDEQLDNALGISPLDLYNKEKLDISISEIISPLYMDLGYFYFQIVPEVKPVAEDSLDVIFKINENNIVTINNIIISGNDKTSENVIRRELRIFPGDIFNRKKLLDSYRDIMILNYFQNVMPNVEPVGDEKVDLKFNVEEKGVGQANFSMGYNQLYGFTGGGGFQFPNFRGKGQNLAINYQRGLSGNSGGASSYNNFSNSYSNSNSTPYQSFSISFTEPWLYNTPNLVGFSYFYSQRGQGANFSMPFDILQNGGSIKFGRKFKWPDRYSQGTWSLKIQKTTYSSDNKELLSNWPGLGTPYFSNEKYNFSTSGISLIQNLSRDTRNHPEYPTNGSKTILNSTISGSFLGGSESYLKNSFDASIFNTLYKKLVVVGKIKFGHLMNLEKDRSGSVPYYTRFFLGGTGIPYGEMLRGYTDNKVGPINSSYTTPLGGNMLFKSSLEFRLLLSDNPTIYALCFAEAGNLWKNHNSFAMSNFKRSVGFGVRLFMPMIGLLGYDIGYGFDTTEYDKLLNGDSSYSEPHGFEYHFIFGMPF